MKKYLAIFIVGIFIWSCGSDNNGGGTTPPPEENKPPSTPTLLNPTNDKLCIDPNVLFEWTTSTDPDGDSVKYQLLVATDNQFTQIAHDIQNISSPSHSISLNKGKFKQRTVKVLLVTFHLFFNFILKVKAL